MQTVQVSPVALSVGDRVYTHGALLEVTHITRYMSDGVEVAACTSRLIGTETGSIPRGWFDTPESLRERGCVWATELPEGHYWNVQGNHRASVAKVVG